MTISWVYNLAPPNYTALAIEVIAGYGNTLAGASVTAYFDDSTTETVSFVDSGGYRGDAIGTGWRLYVDGKTGPAYYQIVYPDNPEYWSLGGQPWHFVFEGKTAGLVRLVVDLRPSSNNLVFDTDNLPEGVVDGTPGSAGGASFLPWQGLDVATIAVEYTGWLTISGGSEYTDLFLVMDVVFSGTLPTETFTFFQDHDATSTAPSVRTTGKYAIIWINT